MTVIPEGFGEIAFRFALTGDPEEMLITFGFSDGLPLIPATTELLVAAAAEVEAEFFENVVVGPAAFYAGWSYLGARYTVHGVGDPEIIGLVPRTVAGTAVGETPPVNVSWLIHKMTQLGGNRGRGRAYMPPCDLQEIGISKQGVIDVNTLPAVQAKWTAFLDELVADDGALLYLLHSDSEAVPPSPRPEPTLITQLVVDNRVATQRRRLRS